MTKSKLNKILESYFLLIIILLLIFVYTNQLKSNISTNIQVMILFSTNGIIIIRECIRDKYNYSLNKIYWYFSFFFMFFSPLLQYLSEYRMWGFYYSDYDYINTNVILIIWNCIYIFTNRIYKVKSKEKDNSKKINYSDNNLYIGCFISFLSLIIMIALVGGIKNFFIRNTNNVLISNLGFINTLLNNFFRTIPFYFFLYSIYYYKMTKKRKILVTSMFFLILTIVLNDPISMTRYWTAGIYFGIVICLFNNFIKNKRFDFFLIIIFSVLFPAFQLFKWYSLVDVIEGKAVKDLINCYNNADFDAFSMITRTIWYVKEEGIVFGKSLLTTLLFWIPRIFWKNKQIPTGELIATYQGQKFKNLSAPLIAEGYINFGFFGIITYSICLSMLIKFLDYIYWNYSKEGSYIIYIYPSFLGLLVFILRGAFHPAIVYTFVFYLFIIIIKIKKKLCNKKILNNQKN